MVKETQASVQALRSIVTEIVQFSDATRPHFALYPAAPSACTERAHRDNNNNNIYAGGPRRVPPATSDSTP
jgi:hypothetical protein